MAKKILPVIIVAFILMATLACNISVPTGGIRAPRVVEGSGDVKTETRDVSGFTEVSLEGIGDLYIEQGSQEALEIEAEDNLLDLIETVVEGDTLRIRFEELTAVNNHEPIIFRLQVKELDSISISGAGNAEADGFEADELRLTVNGSGDMHFSDLTASRVNVNVPGAGNIRLSGSANELDLTFSGMGKYNGFDFAVERAAITINGAGDAEVNASETLDVNINGAGNVKYMGSPDVSENINGVGEISPR